ncbi:MAG: hypothetical protein GXY83_13460 [Rhodopirellula sp.]|nr:hypothetical protein [Rhodopirellula sp.]
MLARTLVLLLVPLAAPPANDTTTVYRYDPLSDEMVPIARAELRAGCIYNHFNPRLNRRAWSYFQNDGTFWHAMGEGTTQEALRLDVRATEEEKQQRLRDLPGVADDYYRTGGKVFLRLKSDGRWEVAGVRILAKIYDAETGRLWERYGDKYIPVGHTHGKQWGVQNGRYHPAGS